ncbi:hypothetical protein MJT46_001761 [Ovis ammon polii x Ovis aries]|nr:hypothetical protein MJT46_001761 [Ovis ammon polii x Ovis aries]
MCHRFHKHRPPQTQHPVQLAAPSPKALSVPGRAYTSLSPPARKAGPRGPALSNPRHPQCDPKEAKPPLAQSTNIPRRAADSPASFWKRLTHTGSPTPLPGHSNRSERTRGLSQGERVQEALLSVLEDSDRRACSPEGSRQGHLSTGKRTHPTQGEDTRP